jgi:uncharacterized protein (TIGR04255 family)
MCCVMVRLPKRIDPCPIIEAVYEIRYTSHAPSEAVFGMIYTQVKDLLPSINKLPILELPETIRSEDPNLRYQPYYELKQKDNVGLRVGPRVITFSNTKPYQGWTEWSNFINTVLEQVQGSGVIKAVERIGLRYINLFDSSILDQLNLSVVVNDKQILQETTSLRVELNDGAVLKILQVANNAGVLRDGKNVIGSVIDIDCVRNFSPNENYFMAHKEVAADVHQKEKELFFGLLKADILAKFNPIYEEP